jgi:hypothetical protein
LFEDDSLDAAIGRNGMNINLASKITDYKIDAYGINQYERIQEDQKTPLSEIDGIDGKISSLLHKSKVVVVSDLLDADMDSLLSIAGLEEDTLDDIYSAVQTFVERKIEPIVEEVEDIQEILNEANLDENEIVPSPDALVAEKK